MNIINAILDFIQKAAISHYRVLLLLSVIWFTLALFAGRRKRPVVFLLYVAAGIIFVILSMCCFMIALKSMRLFARIGAIAGMISMTLLIILCAMFGLSWRHLSVSGFAEKSKPYKEKRNGDRQYNRKRLLIWLTIVFSALLLRSPGSIGIAFGAEKINKVNIKFRAEDFDSEGYPVIDVNVKNDRYMVNELDTAWAYFRENQGERETDDTYVVELGAAEGFYFNITKSNGIFLNGAGAELVKASRRDNGQTLVITVRLTRLEEFMADIGGAAWQNGGYAIWEEAHGAYLYKVLLTDPKGRKRRAETGGNRYDFRPFLLEAGTYEFQVQPVSMSGKTGSWCYGGAYFVSEEEAKANDSTFKVEVEYSYVNGIKTPANCMKSYLNTGWQKVDGRFWYRNEDGSYPQSVWMKEEEDWYYFHSDGYLAQSEYISWAEKEYYVDADGKMAVDTVTPDGRKASADGKIL